jgi:beta-galactosidase
LQTILCTPTATPPAWLIHQHPDILPVDALGAPMGFGARKHYCHTHPTYRQYAQRIVAQLAEHYRDNPHVYAWQLDNEFGDHDTVRCYCAECQRAFIAWLQEKYSSLDALNRAWGTIFWSQEYSAWEQIPLPAPRRPIGLNPSHLLDYYRFASGQVIEFAALQAQTLRARGNPMQRITTNIIPTFWEIDFGQLAQALDFVGWDCYTVIDAMSPIRYPPDTPPPPLHLPPRPAMVALVHDMMRSFTQQPFWVSETAGQDRLITYHLLAHGGAGISFFCWRSPRFGAEQSRLGYAPHGIRSPRYVEAQQLGAEMQRLGDMIAATTFKPAVGLLYSFDMGWAYDIAYVYPRSTWVNGASYWQVLEEYYTHLWRHNVPVQPLTLGNDSTLISRGTDTEKFATEPQRAQRKTRWSPCLCGEMAETTTEVSLANYGIVIAPCLYLVNDAIIDKLCAYVAQGGTLIVGPGSGTKDWHNVYIEELPPAGKLRQLFGCTLVGQGSWQGLYPLTVRMEPNAPFAAGQTFPGPQAISGLSFVGGGRPSEELRAEGATVIARFAETDVPAATLNRYGQGCAIYLGWTPDAAFFDALIGWLEKQGKLFRVLNTPPGVEATLREGNGRKLIFLINHNFAPATVALDQNYVELISNQIVTGSLTLAAQSAAILEPVTLLGKRHFTPSPPRTQRV